MKLDVKTQKGSGHTHTTVGQFLRVAPERN
jgi:hypothetical protein